MQVKKRINRIFGSILRKDKGDPELENQKESSSRSKKKWNNQSYSQWDLMEHMALDSEEVSNLTENKMIVSDGLALNSLLPCEEPENDIQLCEELNSVNKQKSFLKRSGSLLRRSLRRKSKKEKTNHNHINNSSSKSTSCESDQFDQIVPITESLTNIVQEINETLLAVAAFPEANNTNFNANKPVTKHDHCKNNNNHAYDDSDVIREWCPDSAETEAKKEKKSGGLTNGLRRRASKLASKFHKSPAAPTRLKSTASLESVPNTTFNHRQRSASFTASNGSLDKVHATGGLNRFGSLRRRISFKRTKKAVRKGVSSVGKSFLAAGSITPAGYDYPPPTLYPTYNNYEEDEYPNELQRYYYKTHCYQSKEQNHRDYSEQSFSHYGCKK